ncbi:nitroreductase [Nocardia transvalensis]|uniref:Nitroreductase n=1 Tax=Nocardia transvalensis TaxID=37333 RepID=A0A7W9PFX8_9NOCA|nr:NAD(P)H nitroreductase [Nocardia transvalensis]MBB5915372.1 nitroreductase [Nocardia transvalensis]
MDSVPTSEVVEKAVQLAGRAPSLHNSQPWRWVFDGAALRLFSVPERTLPATDGTGRQTILACGIALGHLHVAMAAAGWRTLVARLPDPDRREPLATVRFRRARLVTDADRARVDAISARHTDRSPYAPPCGWDAFAPALRSAFDPADATLDVIPDDERPTLAHASELTAALRRYDSGYQAELRWWAGHVVGRTGVPRTALTAAEEQGVSIARKMPPGTSDPRASDPGIDRSTILLLSTADDAPGSLVRCGEALSTILLECTLAGYATCPLTHLTEYPRARSVVARLTDRNLLPQVLIRVGIVSPPRIPVEPTPRLPLADILENRSPPPEDRG